MTGDLDQVDHGGNKCDEQHGTCPAWSDRSNEGEADEQRTCGEDRQHATGQAYFQWIEHCAHAQCDTHQEDGATKHSSQSYRS